MSSKAQKKQGYPLPEDELTEETVSFCVTIPEGFEYYNAFYAQMLELGKWWKWKRDEERPHAATDAAMTWRSLLSIEENCGGGDVATKEDIRDGIYEAANRIALQIASGQYANLGFTTDEDGVVTPNPPSGQLPDEDLPEDDPTTEYNETEAAKYGGNLTICRAVELYFDKIDTYYGTTNGSPTLTQPEILNFIEAYFPVDSALVDVGLTSYFNYRMANPILNLNFTNANQLYIYCHGSNQQAINQWLIDSSAYAIGKINVMLKMVAGLTPEFFSFYFSDGVTKPSTVYLDASCVKVPPQTLTGLVFGTPRVTNIMKANHRMRMQQSGYALDVDGDIQDSFWYRTAAGVLTRTNWTYSQSGQAAPTDLQVPYNSAHVYDYTIDLLGNTLGMTITPNKHANMNAVGLTYPVPFDVTTTDLGEYTIQ